MTDDTTQDDSHQSTNEKDQLNQTCASVIPLDKLAEAKRHAQKEDRLNKMKAAFEKYRPIEKESRQVKRRKARKNKKGKKK